MTTTTVPYSPGTEHAVNTILALSANENTYIFFALLAVAIVAGLVYRAHRQVT